MNRFIKCLDFIYLSIKISLQELHIFPRKNCGEMVKVSGIITVILTTCHIFNIPTLIDYRGGIVATILFGLFKLLVEKYNNT